MNTKKLITLSLSVVLAIGGSAFADSVESYQLGNTYMKNNQFSYAINEYKKVLRIVPSDINCKISLINAYLARATYYNNKVKNYNKAGIDLRNALFYLEMYDDSVPDEQMQRAIDTTKANLNGIIKQTNTNQDAQSHFYLAKELRNQGEFAASAYEYNISRTNADLKKESLIALGDLYSILCCPVKSAFFYERAVEAGAKGAEFDLKMATALQKSGNEEAAIKAYNRLLQEKEVSEEVFSSIENIWRSKLQANNNDAEAYANLGVIYQKRKNYTEAMEYYRKAESINPSNVNTRLNFGLLFQEQKNYPAALEAYESILKLYPNHVEARVYKAQILEALGRKEEAVTEYRRALAFDPKNEIARASLYNISKNTMTPQQLISYMTDLYLEDPTNADLAYDLAFEMHKFKMYDDALKYYNLAIKYNPNMQDAYINISQIYNLKKDFSASRQILNEALKVMPSNNDILAQLNTLDNVSSTIFYSDASNLYNEKKYDEAIEEYLKIIPQSAESNIGIGACYQAKEDYNQAINYFKKALSMKQNDPEIMYYIGSCYLNLNDTKNAKFFTAKAYTLAPKNEKIKELNDYIKAQDANNILDKAIKAYDAKNYNQALMLLSNVLTNDPQNAYGYYYRGLINDALKKYTSAIADYKKAYQLNPELTVALYSIGVCYDYQAQYKNAKLNYKKYLEKAGTQSNEYTKYALERVEQLKNYE